MKMTPFKIVLFSAFGLFAFLGLFVFATYSGSNTGAKGVGAVVIWGTLPQSQMAAALSTLTLADQSMKGVSYVQVSEGDLLSKLTSAIATGNSPDLVLASQEDLHALQRFLLVIPPSQLSQSTFTNGFVSEGNLLSAGAAGYYGVPLLLDPLALFSNNATLSSAGIAKPPASWDALTGLVPNVAQLTSTRQITQGLIALGTYANVHNARGILSALFLQTGVPISAYSANGVLQADLGQNTANGVPPGQAVVRFYTQFADPTKISYTWNASLPDSQQAFLAGNLALYLGYVSEAQYLRAANPNLSFSVSTLPQASNSAKVTYALLYSLMIPRGAKNSAGALSAAIALAQPSAQAVLANATGLAPASRTALTQVPNDPVAAVAYSEALYAEGWLSPQPVDTDSAFSGMISNVISGQMTLDTALTVAARTLSSLLQQ